MRFEMYKLQNTIIVENENFKVTSCIENAKVFFQLWHFDGSFYNGFTANGKIFNMICCSFDLKEINKEWNKLNKKISEV